MRISRHIVNALWQFSGLGLIALGLACLYTTIAGPVELFAWRAERYAWRQDEIELKWKPAFGRRMSELDERLRSPSLSNDERARLGRDRQRAIDAMDTMLRERAERLASVQRGRWRGWLVAAILIVLGRFVLFAGRRALRMSPHWGIWDIHPQRLGFGMAAALAMISIAMPWSLQKNFPNEWVSPSPMPMASQILVCFLPAVVLSFHGDRRVPLQRWKWWVIMIAAIIGICLAAPTLAELIFQLPQDPLDFSLAEHGITLSGPYFFIPSAIGVCLTGIVYRPQRVIRKGENGGEDSAPLLERET